MARVNTETSEDLYDARLKALESLYGESGDMVLHSSIPFFVGHQLGGAADIFQFKKHIRGIVSVTFELIGNDQQKPNRLGNYELAICHRAEEDWGPDLIGRLAYYTLEAVLEPGQTMSIEAAVPEGSSITALLFMDFGRCEVLGEKSGVLLCLGITAEELQLCRQGKRLIVEAALKDQGVYPYTDLYRNTITLPK